MTPITINGYVVYFSFDPNGDVIYINIPPIDGIYVGGITIPAALSIQDAIGLVESLISYITTGMA